MNLEYIKTLIESALHDLLNHDSMILNLKLKEECINHRFAIYIENIFKNTSNHEFLDRLSFDIEYNKSYFDEKEIIDEHDVRLRNCFKTQK